MRIEPRVPTATADISRGSSSPKRFWANAALVVCFFAVLWLVLGWTADAVVHFMPLHWEQKLAFPVPQAWDEEFPVPATAQAVFDRVVQASGSRRGFRLHMIPDPEPNAFAVPGGRIGITTGLLDTIDSEEALAFVIAHEVGHFEHRHLLKKMSRSVSFGLAKSVLFGGRAGTGSLGSLDALGELSYSRRQERQADLFALECLYRAYGHVGGAVTFFRRIESGDLKLQMLRTHPLPVARIRRINEKIAEFGFPVEPVTALPRE